MLGPDFHRLDRTSLRLAHLFDHLVGAEHQAGRNFMAERFCKLQIDDQLELGWLFDREIGRLCAAQDSCAIPVR